MSTATSDVTGAPVRPRRPFPLAAVIGVVVTAVLAVWSIVGLSVQWAKVARLYVDSAVWGVGFEFNLGARLWAVFSAMRRNFDWSLLPTALGEMWTSVAIAWLGTMLAGIVAVPLGLLAAENLVGRRTSLAVRQVFNVLRAIPELVLVLMVLPVLGFTYTAGVVALGIGSIGTLSKLCSEAIENIENGPIEAADACGATTLQRLRWAVIPQSAPEIISFILYRFEINIRVSAVLGLLGVGGIGGKLANSLQFNDWGAAGVRLFVVIVATILIDTLSGWVRRRILSGPPGTRADDESPPPTPLPAVEPLG